MKDVRTFFETEEYGFSIPLLRDPDDPAENQDFTGDDRLTYEPIEGEEPWEGPTVAW